MQFHLIKNIDLHISRSDGIRLALKVVSFYPQRIHGISLGQVQLKINHLVLFLISKFVVSMT